MDFSETVLWASLATLIAITLGVLYKTGAFRRRKPNEPPLDKGLLPWIGHGISFGRNPLQFLEKMRKKHGDVFTLLVGGNYLHFVMDSHAYGFIAKQSRSQLDVGAFGEKVAFNVFNIQPTKDHYNIIEVVSKKHLQGKSLVTLNKMMMKNLTDILLHKKDSGEGGKEWQQDGLFHFSYKTIFQAAFLTIFGSESEEDAEGKEKARENAFIQTEKLFEEFQRFDDLFPQMAINILGYQSRKESQRLRNYFWDLLSVKKLFQRNNISSWVEEAENQMAEIGMSEEVRTQVQLLLLWASQTNSGPASFWLLAHLLKYPEAMKVVRGEVESVLRESGQEVKPDHLSITLSLDAVKTPFLDSAVEETLRLQTGSYMYRSVMKDFNLKMDDGREYLLREKDQLLFPFFGVHLDPEIYSDPEMFKYDRFIRQDGTKKEFFKNGKKLKNPLVPFGGGFFMCPGRFFAVHEMKMFVIMMLTYLDMELLDQEEDLPPSNWKRAGTGSLQPMHDIKFKYRPRF